MQGQATVRKKLDPALTGHEAERLALDLRTQVVGQDEAIEQIVNVYQTYLAGMNSPGRPVGSFLFLGPTGTGKTHVVEATALSLLGDRRAITKIDCSEFQHSHEIAKLIGSPPGYLGHRETKSILSQRELDRHQTENTPISIVLFDEIEKAHDALWHLLLGVLDKAELTLGDNSKTDFSKSLIFMTSNLGAHEIQALMSHGMGFSALHQPRVEEGQVSRAGLEAARKRFSPEFINRLDKIVAFQRLGEEQLRRVLELELAEVQQRVLGRVPFSFRLTEAARGFLLEEGTDARYGARHLKRAIERSLVYPMANLIASGQVREGDVIEVDFDAERREMTFERIDVGAPVYTKFQTAGLFVPDEDQAAAA